MLDADVFIADERGHFNLARWLSAQPDNDIEMAAITAAELWYGLERATGAHRARRQAYIETALALSIVVPYTLQTAQIHARLWAGLEARGQMIGYHDLIVAATAIVCGVPVATFNARHFSAAPGLRVIVP